MLVWPCLSLILAIAALTARLRLVWPLLRSSALPLNFAGHKYPDELQALVWLFFSPASTHHKPRRAKNARLAHFHFFTTLAAH